ncbi:MAG: hypothetical protein HY744_33920 [Deltaproteobacteria bacterium]|nr:hypothetical protein [Deltaproteobacteria bacterium]
MKRVVLFSTVLAVVALAPSAAHANPMMTCMPGEVKQPAAGSVELGFEADAQFVKGKLIIYRDKEGATVDPKSPTAVKVAELPKEKGTASKADTGSGVVDTLKFTAEESCVPVGKWTWAVFGDEQGQADLYCPMSAEVKTPGEECGAGGAGTGGAGPGGSTSSGAAGAGASAGSAPAVPAEPPADEGGCAFGPGRAAGTGAALGLALGLLWLARRRRS